MEQKAYNVGLYARLSRDDRNEGESISIQNQRELLTRYIHEHGWNLVSEYVDDGVSGTSFDRPGFNRMMEDAQAGKINLVLVKDLNRFGRAQAETTIYIETTFPELGCRFIAVDDDYDTAHKTDTSETSMLIKSFLNDFYARDTSKKIKTVKRSTFKTGKYIAAHQTVNLVLGTIRLAVRKEKKRVAAELQLHSDQEGQYTSQKYFDLTKGYGIIPSMSRRGNCYDNAMAENFFSILKTECIYRQKIATFKQARELIDDFIYFYNHERIQLKTGEAPLALRLSA